MTCLHNCAILCLLLIASPFHFANAQNDEGVEMFLQACTAGSVDIVRSMLAEHPEYATRHSSSGTTCLHVSGGHKEITKLILDSAKDSANILTKMVNPQNEDKFLEMPPLLWHVTGSHMETTKLLLENGADPNHVLDPNAIGFGGPDNEKMTTIDAVDTFLKMSETGGDDENIKQLKKVRELLVSYGGKKHDEL